MIYQKHTTSSRGKSCQRREEEREEQGERDESELYPDGVSDRCDRLWELHYACDTPTAQRVRSQL